MENEKAQRPKQSFFEREFEASWKQFYLNVFFETQKFTLLLQASQKYATPLHEELLPEFPA